MKERMKKWTLRITTLLLILLFIGFFMDALTGFTVIRHSNSVFNSIGALLILGVLYPLTEAFGEWVTSIDKVEQPLWRRALNLCVLLLAIIVTSGVFYYVFTFI